MSGTSRSALSPALAMRVTHGGRKLAPMRHQISISFRNPLTLGNLRGVQKIHTHSTWIVSRFAARKTGGIGCSVKSLPPWRTLPSPAVVIGPPLTYHD